MTIVHILLVIAATKNYKLHQKEVYLKLPAGLTVKARNGLSSANIFKWSLLKAPRYWFSKLAASY